MTTLKGSFYILFQSYKKQNIIFWSILFSIILLSFFLDTFFGQFVSFAITISIPVYIFYSSMAAKFLNKTLPYFLKLGISRQQYMVNIGLFFISWSVLGALIIACTHKTVSSISNLLSVKDIIIIHPALLFDTSPSFLQMMALDTVLLLFCLSSGLLLNVVFYRLGILGGYSFLGLLTLIPIVTIIFEWYSPLFDFLTASSIAALMGALLLFSILLYLVITASMRKVSINPA
ncbi:hypothetical protein I6G82_12645 [Lysinibacillus macroides]|uniref:Uncharacterized protein n=1 Tax=Lysinibacillus macroides TaxID=33935 RepID=A0A0M9DLV2_9BACI|nr:hypothetical protein [Lysinibacillus macroides]KOY82802.1 hypothetical protein ADM90_05615 [Lysinibacillus macroides]QPR66150.1 hypothetical protein I6G82_12645 [Lysinibacillus macroides]